MPSASKDRYVGVGLHHEFAGSRGDGERAARRTATSARTASNGSPSRRPIAWRNARARARREIEPGCNKVGGSSVDAVVGGCGG